MLYKPLLISILCLMAGSLIAQNSKPDSFQIPLHAGLQFQNMAMPFKDLSGNFSNPGLYLGSELTLNRKQTLVQEVSVGYYVNRNLGNGFYATTQLAWRSQALKQWQTGLKLGVGWLRAQHPVATMAHERGQWIEVSDAKSQLLIPVTAQLKYGTKEATWRPFIEFEVTPALFYNEVVPLNIYSSFKLGASFQISKPK